MIDAAITERFDDETGESLGFEFNDEHMAAVVKSLAMGNTFVPAIDKVLYNYNEDLNVLTTVVYFADGTKTMVKNCGGDRVETETKEVELSDGSSIEVVTASRQSREAGLAHAIAKRVACGYSGSGYGNFLKNVVGDSYCQDINEKMDAAEDEIDKRERAKKELERAKAEKNPPKPEPTLQDTVNSLCETVGGLIQAIADMKTARGSKSRPKRARR